MALSHNIGDETSEVLAAQAHIANHVFNYINSMSLKCAIQLGIPDIIHSHGRAMTLSDLVNALSINKSKGQDCIYRLMRILIHAGFFIQTKSNEEQDQEEGYLLTPTSRLLLKNEPLSLVPFVQAQLDPILMDPWHSLGKWFKNDDSTPFATAHGKPLFEYAGDEPRLNRLFNEAMASDARLIMSVLIKNGKGVFEGLTSLVDVGGGIGTVAKAISNAFLELKCFVFDLPHVVEGLEGSNNLSYVGGDMFKSIPSADAILLKWILHDWSDDDCVKILKKCKEAIPSKENGGKVIIIDIVVDNQKGDNKSYETQLFSDVLMMVHVSGKERNRQDWAKLFFDAGFSDYKISPILGLRSVIEVYP
ncbi:trans-resveratrol di-O-methyltransferase-like [Lycium ferocissimum]|uniref:trans-resveratrol di-O-methyltransferase-like n=1 Tax=Lycium ferocissimum TaxID=112874 RepID=UPI002815837D|nr:trans-resveratrol di-O-methyltransferase-like [Lycium ferocissimum]